jgi:hypothetical protein
MSGKNQHTWQQHHVGQFLLTIQLDSVDSGRSIERHHGVADVAKRLIALADTQRLPVTWAVSDPAHSAATSLIMRSAIEHELAILGDANWVGPTAGRTRFARELARRLAQARSTGLEITSLVPHVASVENQIDLVVKQNITAVAGYEIATTSQRPTAPRALHYGVWELPISERLPLQVRRWLGNKWAFWKQIRRFTKEAGTYHLMIDAPALADGGRSSEALVSSLAKWLSLLRDRGIVRIETLRSTAARLAAVPAGRPQRSILRAA